MHFSCYSVLFQVFAAQVGASLAVAFEPSAVDGNAGDGLWECDRQHEEQQEPDKRITWWGLCKKFSCSLGEDRFASLEVWNVKLGRVGRAARLNRAVSLAWMAAIWHQWVITPRIGTGRGNRADKAEPRRNFVGAPAHTAGKTYLLDDSLICSAKRRQTFLG